MANKTLTPKEIANDWEISPKTLRKFLRKDEKILALCEGNPGKGGRWSIPAGQVKTLRKRFDAWVAANKTKTEDAADTEVTTPEEPTAEDFAEVMNDAEDGELESH